MRRVTLKLEAVLQELIALVVPAVLVFLTLAVVSCKMTAEGVEALDGDVQSPVLVEFNQMDETRFHLSFSEEVSLDKMEILEDTVVVHSGDALSVEMVPSTILGAEQDTDFQTDGATGTAGTYDVVVSISSDVMLPAGKLFTLAGVASDTSGNSLSFSIPFHGYNSNTPGLVISEIRTEYSKPKVEFIEFYVYKPGDLAGVTLYSAYDDKYGEYVFPSVQVEAGEYFVLHFRTLEEQADGCIDETGTDLNCSTAVDSCADVRDFWVNGTSARLGKYDVVLLRERSGGKLMDALPYAPSTLAEWKNDAFLTAVSESVEDGAWNGGTLPSEVVCSDGVTLTRTLSRQNIVAIESAAEAGTEFPANNTDCWFVAKKATPGAANSTEKYVKQ